MQAAGRLRLVGSDSRVEDGQMLKLLALGLLIVLFPTLMISIILGLFAHPYFFLLLVLAILFWPSIMVLRRKMH